MECPRGPPKVTNVNRLPDSGDLLVAPLKGVKAKEIEGEVESPTSP